MYNHKNILTSTVLFCSLFLLPASVLALPTYYGTPVSGADLSSSRSVSGTNELTVINGSAPGGTVSWNINFSGGLWNYTYTFSGFGSDVSHVTFDLSDAFAYDGSGVMQNVTTTIGTSTESRSVVYGTEDSIVGAGKVQIPGGNAVGFTLSFTSTNAPMWADIFIKAGNFEVTNYNYLNHIDNDLKTGYIATPDTYIPAPGAIILGGIGVGLVNLLRRRRML